jgi:Uncharacterised protein family UPF0547
MRGGDLLSWLLGLVLVFLYASMMGAIAIGGGSSFFVGFVPGLLIGLWGLIAIQRELSRKSRELDEAVAQGLSNRQCPQCGRPVRIGVLECPHCGFAWSSTASSS